MHVSIKFAFFLNVWMALKLTTLNISCKTYGKHEFENADLLFWIWVIFSDRRILALNIRYSRTMVCAQVLNYDCFCAIAIRSLLHSFISPTHTHSKGQIYIY